MDFWHDAAAQKRWLRRFALLTGVLLLPVLVLAVFARPSADDFIYAAAPMPRCSSTVLTCRVCCGPRGTPTSTTMRTGRDSTFPALRWRFSPPSSATDIMVPRWSACCCRCFSACMAGTVRGAASGPGAKASALGTDAAADLRLYRGHARPRGGIVLVQRCHELPAVLFAGRAERRAGVCALLCR